jgi:LPXTG-motif cell wall-anchored protein
MTPLGEFPNIASSDNPATGVASPVAAGAAAIASLALAFKSRKKKK